MKVTKTIREYVEEQVSKVYNSKVNPYSEQAAKDRQLIAGLAQHLRQQQRDAIRRFLAENVIYEESYRTGFVRKTEPDTSVPSFHYYWSEAMCEEKKWDDDNRKAKSAKIREILVSLELGANRQELNDMIAKLMEVQE